MDYLPWNPGWRQGVETPPPRAEKLFRKVFPWGAHRAPLANPVAGETPALRGEWVKQLKYLINPGGKIQWAGAPPTPEGMAGGEQQKFCEAAVIFLDKLRGI
jgi:hypothetical protein